MGMRLAVLSILVLLSGCGPAVTAAPSVQRAHLTAGSPSIHQPTKVLLVVEENHSQAQARSGMPYLVSLGRRYGHTTNYRALAHPSLPNYLALTGGSTFGVRDDSNPAAHPIGGRSVFDQAIARHKSAKVYVESMPENCALTPSGNYAVKHNPWSYFNAPTPRADCRRHDVPAGTTVSGALHRDVVKGHLPTIGMLVPNLCDDAHNCPLATADSWLRTWMKAIEAGPDWKSGRLAVVITFDENDGVHPNTVLTTVASRSIRHRVSRDRYSHYSWTRLADQLIGAQPLRHARHARSLRVGFNL
jgi:phosphatidylinositol-3-phosphatase